MMEEAESIKFPEEIPDTEKKVKEQNKLLRNIFIVFGIFIVGFISIYVVIYFMDNFEYNGVKFSTYRGNIIQGMTIYGTSFPVEYKGETADYYFYLRNDPRTLEYISFDGPALLSEIIVINVTDEEGFNCEGKGVIAIANLAQMYEFLGSKFIKDPNATCDSEGRYMFIQIQPGNITSIEKTGPICYTINVKDCEILEATEKLMVETFIKINRPKETA